MMTETQVNRYEKQLKRKLIELPVNDNKTFKIPEIANLLDITEDDALCLVRYIATNHFNIFDSISYKLDYAKRCKDRGYFRHCGHKIGGAVIIGCTPGSNVPVFKEDK